MGRAKRQKPQVHQRGQETTESEETSEQSDAGLASKKQRLNRLATQIVQKREESLFMKSVKACLIILGFSFTVLMGHFYISLLVMILICGQMIELLNVRRKPGHENQARMTLIDVWFLITFFYSLTPRIFLRRSFLEGTLPKDHIVFEILYNKNLIVAFSMAAIGFLGFTLCLEKGLYKAQFKHFSWSLVAMLVGLSLPSLVIHNIYQGLFWFVVPHFSVTIQSITSYLVNKCTQGTQITNIAPKRTWEGLLIGVAFSMISTLFLAEALSEMSYFTCPQVNFFL